MAEEHSIVEREAQIVAAVQIGKLNCKQKQRLNNKEVISQLIIMLHAEDNQSVETALFALLNLSFGSERNKVKYGALPAILEILEWRREAGSLVELAVATMLVLSSCTTNKPDIAASRAVQVLFQTRYHIHIAQSLNFSTNNAIYFALRYDCLISLVQLIYTSEKSSELVEKAVGLLESLVSTSDIALNQVCEIGGAIGMLVEKGTGSCKEHAAGVLVLICKSSKERYKAMILSEGAMPGLLQLSIDGTRRARQSFALVA